MSEVCSLCTKKIVFRSTEKEIGPGFILCENCYSKYLGPTHNILKNALDNKDLDKANAQKRKVFANIEESALSRSSKNLLIESVNEEIEAKEKQIAREPAVRKILKKEHQQDRSRRREEQKKYVKKRLENDEELELEKAIFVIENKHIEDTIQREDTHSMVLFVFVVAIFIAIFLFIGSVKEGNIIKSLPQNLGVFLFCTCVAIFAYCCNEVRYGRSARSRQNTFIIAESRMSTYCKKTGSKIDFDFNIEDGMLIMNITDKHGRIQTFTKDLYAPRLQENTALMDEETAEAEEMVEGKESAGAEATAQATAQVEETANPEENIDPEVAEDLNKIHAEEQAIQKKKKIRTIICTSIVLSPIILFGLFLYIGYAVLTLKSWFGI